MSSSSAWDSLPKQFIFKVREPELRQKLKQAITKYINRLQAQRQIDNSEKIQKLKLRLSLIDYCGEMSLLRLDHLEEIFKHYCTHIFRIGKHMTFDRLQYEKTHLTMERFFLFIKDFGLTTMDIAGKQKQIIDKNLIILTFKKVSSNCYDLTFEEFISCLEKIGVIYFNQKEDYFKKQQRKELERRKKKQDYERKKKMKIKKTLKQEIFQEEGKIGEQSKQQKEQNEENKEQQQDKQEEHKQQNDDLVKDMLNNENLEDPNDEVKKLIHSHQNKEEREEEQTVQWQPQKIQENPYQHLEADDMLLLLTKNEKIEFFYRVIGVDSVGDYRKRLTELNLPMFNHYSKSSKGPKTSRKDHNQSVQFQPEKNSPKLQKSFQDLENQERMMALKQKLNQKKVKLKNTPIPKPKKDDLKMKEFQQQRKKKREQNKQRLDKVKKNKEQSDEILQKKMDLKRQPFFLEKNKVDYNQKQVNWDLMKMSIDQLKLKFQPQKLFAQQEQDKIYMQQYSDHVNKGRAGSVIERRSRNSTAVVQNIKKRVQEVDKKQKKQQKNVNMDQIQLNNISKKIGRHELVRERF